VAGPAPTAEVEIVRNTESVSTAVPARPYRFSLATMSTLVGAGEDEGA
jgi:hypothetical protein